MVSFLLLVEIWMLYPWEKTKVVVKKDSKQTFLIKYKTFIYKILHIHYYVWPQSEKSVKGNTYLEIMVYLTR